MRVLDLFSAAAGGWSLGMHRAGYRTIAACEVIPWRRALYSQNNPGVPVYDDVTTLTAERLIRDIGYLPDVIVGSPPCQDISSANTKGQGVDGERSKLYFEAVRLVDECRPRWFALENSANLRTRGADRVIDALEAIGYTCWPFVVSAGDIGANHPRKRSWLIGFNARDAEKNGWGTWRTRGRPVAVAGLPVEACGDANATSERREPWSGDIESEHSGGDRRFLGDSIGNGIDADATSIGHEGRRPRRYGQDGDGSPPVASGVRNAANSNEEGQKAGLLESSLRPSAQPINGCGDVGSDDVSNPDSEGQLDGPINGEMGGSESVGATPAEPWSDWNGGLAHHLRVDDGLSAWVAQSRIAIGGPRGTVAASLIVEAFGDAVVPQIPEAIGRAISRVERALSVLYANDNTPTKAAA